VNKLWLEKIVNKGYTGYSLRKVITTFTDSSCLKGIGMYLKASLMARDSGKPLGFRVPKYIRFGVVKKEEQRGGFVDTTRLVV
jgi:hypothetical protein